MVFRENHRTKYIDLLFKIIMKTTFYMDLNVKSNLIIIIIINNIINIIIIIIIIIIKLFYGLIPDKIWTLYLSFINPIIELTPILE